MFVTLYFCVLSSTAIISAGGRPQLLLLPGCTGLLSLKAAALSFLLSSSLYSVLRSKLQQPPPAFLLPTQHNHIKSLHLSQVCVELLSPDSQLSFHFHEGYFAILFIYSSTPFISEPKTIMETT